jgi:hypothetical protein
MIHMSALAVSRQESRGALDGRFRVAPENSMQPLPRWGRRDAT